MYCSISEIIRKFAAGMEEGEVVKKYKPAPKIKPPRRQPDVETKSNRSDYMKHYMTEYREEGKDYQKVPDKVKEYRREEKKKIEKESDGPLYARVGIDEINPNLLFYSPSATLTSN